MMAGNHLTETFCLQCRIQGSGPGDLGLPLFLNQAEARRAEKIFLGDRPPSLSEGLDDPPPPPPPFQGLDPALVYYRVLPRKREFIPRGTQNIKVMLFLLPELFRLFR